MPSKPFPTTSAQDQVLRALGLKAENYPQAQRILEACGLHVTPVRQGRSSVPSISLIDATIGGWHGGDDADGWSSEVNFQAIDLTPILHWIVAKDQPEAQRRIAKAQASTVTVDADALVAADYAERDREAQERRDNERMLKANRQAHFQRRSALYAAGYRWRNLGTVVSEDGDTYALYDPDGNPVEETEALQQIGWDR